MLALELGGRLGPQRLFGSAREDDRPRSRPGDEQALERLPELALGAARGPRRGRDGLFVVVGEGLVDVAEGGEIVSRDLGLIGGDPPPQLVADDLQVERLDELSLDGDRLSCAGRYA